MRTGALSCSVIVPTYARADQLPHCLQALRAQERPAEQVLVVCRPDDLQSRQVLTGFPECQEVLVNKPGLVAALRAGYQAATSEVIVTTDDDARGRPDWLARLLGHYADPAVGAVGGRDVVHHAWGVEQVTDKPVGRVRWYGRMDGRHHLGRGPARDVHFLKGVNSSWRRELLAFPHGLRGAGGEVAGDLASSLAVHVAGRRVIYDPAAVVDHYPGRRLDADRRVAQQERREVSAVQDSVYNETFVLASLLPALRWRRALYALLVGDRATVGFGRAAVARLRGEQELRGMRGPTAAAVREALRDARRQPLQMTSAP